MNHLARYDGMSYCMDFECCLADLLETEGCKLLLPGCNQTQNDNRHMFTGKKGIPTVDG